MQWNAEHRMVSKQRLAGALGEMGAAGVVGSALSGHARSEEGNLQAQTRAFGSLVERLQQRQDELEASLRAQGAERQALVETVDTKLSEQTTTLDKEMREMKTATMRRLAQKEDSGDQIIAELTRKSEAAVEEVKAHARELENSIKFRVSDCETLVKSRITEEYVKNLGERIKLGILDSVSTVIRGKADYVLISSSNVKTRTPSSACTA